MTSRALNLEVCWDLGLDQAKEASQAWVLSAMRRDGPGLIRLLWRILGNDQDVCDAYQDIFLQLAHAPAKPRGDKVRPYLYRTASNVAISMIRRRNALRKTCEKLAADQRTTRQHTVDYAAELDTSALCRAMRLHIARLPEHLRSTIVLRDLAELTYEQVADILSVSPATARVYRCRAVKLLAYWMA